MRSRTVLDLCAEQPEKSVSLGAVVDAAGITRPAARGQLAGLTMVIKRRFSRRNWPFTLRWAVGGDPQAYYYMQPETAQIWRTVAAELDAENSDDNDTETILLVAPTAVGEPEADHPDDDVTISDKPT